MGPTLDYARLDLFVSLLRTVTPVFTDHSLIYFASSSVVLWHLIDLSHPRNGASMQRCVLQLVLGMHPVVRQLEHCCTCMEEWL